MCAMRRALLVTAFGVATTIAALVVHERDAFA
jgi:hypothetical protein